MGDGSLGVQYHAGIVNADETLTKRAIDLFIEEIKKELLLGSDGFVPAFPCGPKISPNPYADLLQLEDEKQYPEFHRQVIRGQYEKIAAILNLKGGFTILPICDPFAIAVQLGIDLDIDVDFPGGFLEYLIPNLPKLALDLDIMPPPKLAAKLPGLLQVPPSLPKISLPRIPNPQLDFVPGLNVDLNFALKLPALILQLIAQIPNLMLNLGNLPSAICNIVFDAGLFSVIPDAIVRIVAYKILVRKIAEMLMIVAVGKVVGSSPQGITGGLGKSLGYQPPIGQRTQKSPRSPRDRIVNYALDCVDLTWGSRDTRDEYVQRLLYTEYGSGERKDNLNKDDPERDPRVIGKSKATERASEVSSCGMLARACCFSGGARYVFKYRGQPLLNKNEKIARYYDFFADEYRLINGSGIAINAILQAAKTKEAADLVPPRHDLPSLKKGDLIVVYDPKISGREHIMIVIEDYEPGSFKLNTVEGGQMDVDNKRRPTAIRKKEYRSTTSEEYVNKTKPLDPPYGFDVTNGGTIRLSGRQILAIIDGEKLCTSKAGSDTSEPERILDNDISDNNDPASDFDSGLLPANG